MWNKRWFAVVAAACVILADGAEAQPYFGFLSGGSATREGGTMYKYVQPGMLFGTSLQTQLNPRVAIGLEINYAMKGGKVLQEVGERLHYLETPLSVRVSGSRAPHPKAFARVALAPSVLLACNSDRYGSANTPETEFINPSGKFPPDLTGSRSIPECRRVRGPYDMSWQGGLGVVGLSGSGELAIELRITSSLPVNAFQTNRITNQSIAIVVTGLTLDR